jgi:hypothetical protein
MSERGQNEAEAVGTDGSPSPFLPIPPLRLSVEERWAMLGPRKMYMAPEQSPNPTCAGCGCPVSRCECEVACACGQARTLCACAQEASP